MQAVRPGQLGVGACGQQELRNGGGIIAVKAMDKYFLLLVRSDDDVPRACREVGEFLAFHRSHRLTIQVEHERRLIGIWIDPAVVDSPPDVALAPLSGSGHHDRPL
jgi:hypothetical protein